MFEASSSNILHWRCKSCNKEVTNRWHHFQTHSSQRSSCPYCPATYSRIDTLRSHMRSRHTMPLSRQFNIVPTSQGVERLNELDSETEIVYKLKLTSPKICLQTITPATSKCSKRLFPMYCNGDAEALIKKSQTERSTSPNTYSRNLEALREQINVKIR